MTMIDDLQKQLKGNFYNIAGKNYVKIFDTPRIWGLPFNKEIMPASLKRENEFQTGITDILQDMRYRCDIASLNPPDEAWREVILPAIDRALSRKIGRTERPQIRFLFAQTTTAILNGIQAPIEGTPDYLALKSQLLNLMHLRADAWEQIPEIWIGRFFRIDQGLLHSLEDHILPPNLTSPLHTKMTWDHAKIIAVDGHESFVGGHNLNMDLFKNYPPVHDVSVKVLGDAPLGSQLYLNNMWDAGTDLLTREYLDYRADHKTILGHPKKNKWVNVDKHTGKPADPFDKDYVMAYVKQQQQAHISNPPTDPEYKLATRIMSVGKYWTGPDIRTDYKMGSEIMKEFLIKNAKRKICMSQQDLVSAWKKNWEDHHVCQWLIEALLANPALEVKVVVSPLDAAAGASGDQYSFGSGAIRTFGLMKYYMTHDVATDALLPDPDGKRADAIKRIEIAPLFYTDKVPSDCLVEGETYKWPDVDKAAYTATLKAPALSKKPPKKGVIGHPFDSLLQASGLIAPKVVPAPGNHAKVTIIDDELYVVGSDNMYPGYQSEFDYLIEGEEAVNAFIKDYWEPLWKYSGPHAVNYKNG